MANLCDAKGNIVTTWCGYCKVVKGDTLSEIAADSKVNPNGLSYQRIATLNDIEDANYIVVDQILRMDGTSVTITTNKTNRAIIKTFGIQTMSADERGVIATWKWNRTSTTDHYKVKWQYDTEIRTGIIGDETTVTRAQSLFTAPAEAIRVKFNVKPIAKKKNVNGKETYEWTADGWSTDAYYSFSDNPPGVPSSLDVEIEGYTLTARLSNLDLNATKIQFNIGRYVIKDGQEKLYSFYTSGDIPITNGAAAFSYAVSAGYEYTVRCRSKRGSLYSDWSDWCTTRVGTPPSAPTRISECSATSATSICVSWPSVKNAGDDDGKKYELQYVEKDSRYFDTLPEAIQKFECTTNKRELTNLNPGVEYFFRVRACNERGESAWTPITSTTLVGSGPDAPTTWSSATSVIVGEPLYLYWVHNSEDGSKQTAAQVELVTSEGDPEIIDITIADNDEDDDSDTSSDSNDAVESYLVQTSNYTYSDGTELYWRVRTRSVLKTSNWVLKDWGDSMTKYSSPHLWTDGTNMYYSYHKDDVNSDYMLQGGNWVTKEWGDLWTSTYPIDGENVWTDGTNTYYSYCDKTNGIEYHYVLTDGVWVSKTWSGLTDFTGSYIWNRFDDEGRIYETYYSNSTVQYVLKDGVWETMDWTPGIDGLSITFGDSFEGKYVWHVGENTYYSDPDGNQCKLVTKSLTVNDVTLEVTYWASMTWAGFESPIGNYIWEDTAGSYHYSNPDGNQYILNGTEWVSESWAGKTTVPDGRYIWTDGTDIYYSASTEQYTIAPEYGKWSTRQLVHIYQKPNITLTLTTIDDDGNTIELGSDDELEMFPLTATVTNIVENQTPLSWHIAIDYDPEEGDETSYETNDGTGSLVSVNKDDTIFSHYDDTSSSPLTLTLSAGDVRLENNKRYRISCVAAMDSGLTAESSMNFKVAWGNYDQYEPNAAIALDVDRFATYIRPYCEDEDGNVIPDIVLDIFRCNSDGSFTAINEEPIENGDNRYIGDPHPALNYARYRIVATSTVTGTVTYTDLANYPIGGKSVVIQWDEQWAPFDTDSEAILNSDSWAGSMLILPYNIDVSDNPTPDVSLIEYIGRKHPVSYYGTQLGETSSWSVAIPKTDSETLYGIRRLAVWPGDVYVREPSGTGYWANIKVSYSQTHGDPVIPITFDITRVEGGI